MGSLYPWLAVSRLPGLVLRGRRDKCAVLDRLLAAARVRHSGALVLRGNAGIAKTALVEYAIGSSSDVRVFRAGGADAD